MAGVHICKLNNCSSFKKNVALKKGFNKNLYAQFFERLKHLTPKFINKVCSQRESQKKHDESKNRDSVVGFKFECNFY